MAANPKPKKLQKIAAKGMKAARGRAIMEGLEPKPAWQQAIPPLKVKRPPISAYEKAQNKALQKLIKQREKEAKQTGNYPNR